METACPLETSKYNFVLESDESDDDSLSSFEKLSQIPKKIFIKPVDIDYYNEDYDEDSQKLFIDTSSSVSDVEGEITKQNIGKHYYHFDLNKDVVDLIIKTTDPDQPDNIETDLSKNVENDQDDTLLPMEFQPFNDAEEQFEDVSNIVDDYIAENLTEKKESDETKNEYSIKNTEQIYETSNSSFDHEDLLKNTDNAVSKRCLFGNNQKPFTVFVQNVKPNFSVFSLTELKNNLDSIVELCEQNTINDSKRKTNLCKKINILKNEKKDLKKIVHQHAKSIGTLENLLALVNKLSDKSDFMSLEEIAKAFKFFQQEYSEEYKEYDLNDLASSLVIPKFKNYLVHWNPLTDSKFPLALFKEWRDILRFGKESKNGNFSDSYDQLIWNAWIPSIYNAIQNWKCKKPEILIDLLNLWFPLIPCWVFDYILDKFILPKLILDVTEWNPIIDSLPIHIWIHPWLPLMKNRMESLIYPIVKKRFGSALNFWHPSDSSARLTLQPWLNVFTKENKNNFLMQNIVPKLQNTLLEFIINPHEQNLNQWYWIYDWKDLIPNEIMASLLGNFFFPKWLQVLNFWLNHAPNYDEITNWYFGWKSLLNENLLSESIIKEYFIKALKMINVSVDQNRLGQNSTKKHVLNSKNLEVDQQLQSSQIFQSKINKSVETVSIPFQTADNYKGLLQKNYEENNIPFSCLDEKYSPTRQSYEIGTNWMPIDLD